MKGRLRLGHKNKQDLFCMSLDLHYFCTLILRKDMEDKKRHLLRNYLQTGILLTVCFFSFFVNNQVIPADIMEARNLATAQEMVIYGNYLLPTLNGEPRLEKPPLPTWIAAGIEHLAPGNLVIQRYATGLSATLMVFFLFLLLKRLSRHRKVALIASLVLATTVNVILMGRTATWDIYTHSFMIGAIYFFVTGIEKNGAQWTYFLLAGLFIGLSFLSKGPTSMYALLIPFLISYFIVYRMSVKEKKWAIGGMIVVALIVSSWWYGYITIFQPDFAMEVIKKESSAWLNYSVRPWYYYWQFPAEAGIWALYWVVAIGYFFVNKRTAYRKEYVFSFLWFLASLVLLSIVPEKKARYLLPLLIPGAMLIGLYFYQMMKALKTKGEKIVFRITGSIIALVLFALPVALYILFYRENQVSLVIFILATVCSWGLFAFIFYALFGKKGIRPANLFIGIILMMLMISSLYLIPIGSLFLNEERNSFRLLRENKELAELEFYYNEKEELRVELVYEANQRIHKMNPEDDAAIERARPFVLISGESIEKLMSNKKVTIDFIGKFDNNWRKTSDKRHNPNLVREVAIVK